MKVLFLTNLPSPYRVRFFTELGKKCELTVIYERDAAGDRDIKWREKPGSSYKEIFLRGIRIGADNSFCPEIIRYLRPDFDIIVVGMYSTYTAMLAMIWMKIRRMKYAISTDGGFIRKESIGKRLFKKLWISSANYWLGTGKLARVYLKHYGAKDDLIYDYFITSVDENDLLLDVKTREEKEKIKEELGIMADMVIISVGQFIPRKGFDVLLHAIEQVPHENVELLLIGGTEKAFQTEISDILPKYVKIIPFLDKQELFRYYCASDFFVLPTREDVWGLVVNEAMACGLPVITTNRCGAGIELIAEGKNGYIVNVDDKYALAMRIKEMLFSTDLTSFGRKALCTMKSYTYQSMAQSCYEIFERNI